jgi:DNA-binding NarL/FixJ family response regulator
MLHLYIIDDHFLIIEGFYSSFDLEADDITVSGGSMTINDAMQNITQENVDIIILDLFICQSDPVSNLGQLRKAFPLIPVVILSQEYSIAWQVAMFSRGIKAYLHKDESKSSMKQTLLRVSSGEVIIPDDVAQALLLGNEDKKCLQHILGYNEIITDLSKGLTVKEIADKLNLSESAIEKKLISIRKCFHVRTNAELVYKAFVKPVSH